MITSDLERLVDAITREKNIPRDVVIEILESAIVAAARRKYGMTRDIEAMYNDELVDCVRRAYKSDIALYKRVLDRKHLFAE